MNELRRNGIRGIFAVASIAALSLAATEALASPTCTCDRGPEEVAYGNAPVNVHVLIAGSTASPAPTLAPKSGGAPVPVTLAPAGDDAGHLWVVPGQDLAPNSDYTLRLGSGASIDIHTGAARDTAPPALGGVSGAAGGFDGACPTQIAASVQASGVTDDTGAPWLRVAFDGAGGHHVVLVRTDATQVGKLADGSCGNATWAQEGAYSVRASAIDQAGNESPAIGPANVTMTRIAGRGSCLCRAAGAPDASPGAIAVAAIACAAWIARARRRNASS